MIEYVNAIARLWWGWTSAMFWQVGLLIVLIACIDRLVRRWAWPQLRYALWSLILIKLLLPPTLSLPSSITPKLTPIVSGVLTTVADEQPTDAMASLKVVPTEVVMPPAVPYTPRLQAEADAMPVAAAPVSALALDWRVYALSFWLTGAAALALFLILRLRSLSKADEGATRAPLPESFYNQLSGCAGRLGLHRLPRVVVTDRITCPAVFGVLRPILLVPRGYLERLSRRDTEHMLLHELAHIKRGDLLVHGVYMLLQIIYWYNPLLWLVCRQVHHLRELCCDATVAGLLREDTGAYRRTLLETAQRFLAKRTDPGLGLLGFFEDSNRLLTRLNWLNKPTWRYRRMKRAIVIAIVGVMLVCVLPMAHSRQAASAESIATPATQPTPEQFAQQMEQLRQQIQQLQKERQQLQQQMQQMTQQMTELARQRAQFVQDGAAGHMSQTYTVRPGDTLASIARHSSDSHEDSLKEAIDHIIEANDLPSADAIQVGQQLEVPLTAEPGVKAAVDAEYVVEALKPGTALTIQNNVGSLKIQGAPGRDCAIKVKVQAKGATQEEAEEMARRVLVQVTPSDKQVRISVQTPDDISKQQQESIQVHLDLTVPQDVTVRAAQNVGDIHLAGLGGSPVQAVTNVGTIRTQALQGSASLQINVGDIEVFMPADPSVRVRASAKVGAISSDLPLDITHASAKHVGEVQGVLGSSATGVLGAGEGQLDLTTNVGSIRIRSAVATD